MERLGIVEEAPELGNFTQKIKEIISKAMQDPECVPPHMLAELAERVLERAVSSVYCVLPAVKLSITIYKKDRKDIYLSSLLSFCEGYFEQREGMLKNSSTFSAYASPRYCAFIQFLQEMYCELKKCEHRRHEEVEPGRAVLKLLWRCCMDCLNEPITQGETDALFFALTTVGKDMEAELPDVFPKLMNHIRDAFLQTATIPSVKKSLLQIIEMRASHWQLSEAAVKYYDVDEMVG